jgi:hypothetical protein
MRGNPPRGELARYTVHALADVLALFLPVALAIAGGRLSPVADVLALLPAAVVIACWLASTVTRMPRSR